MIEYHLDFDGDWEIWQKMCREFRKENGYFVLDEMPGWMRAKDDILQDIRLFENTSQTKTWAVLYFLTEADKTAFLLKWA